MMLIETEFECPYCGETISATIDRSGGQHQSYVEDCQVCCRPIVLNVEVDPNDPDGATVRAEPEMDMG